MNHEHDMIDLMYLCLALVLAPDLESYLVALGHPPIMGQKEQQKKAKRAAAGLSCASPCKAAAPKAPVAKRPAGPAAGSPTEPSDLPGWQLVPTEPPTRPASPTGPNEPLAAGSGNPASSVSSGRVEAEGCGSWEYNEGVGGKYTCAECGARPLRSAFLIEATDLEGNLCVERDLEGRLYGRCYDCCRGRGRRGGLDICAHLVPETS